MLTFSRRSDNSKLAYGQFFWGGNKMIRLRLFSFFIIIGLVAMLINCGKADRGLDSALSAMTAESLAENTRILASDEFEGRAPASRGEEKTISFLKDEFQKLGLEPGNGQSFFQEVPMVKITTSPEAELRVKKGNDRLKFAFGDEFVATTLRVAEESSLEDSDLIFVGYGAVAPEWEWNDYEGLDVRGKTVVVLVNDPGYATGDPELFKGRTMTYYGRWTYKFEEAARQGAAGALIIHETAPAAYGWEVVRKGWTGPQFNLVSEDDNMSRCAVEGWITLASAQEILKKAGLSLDELKTAANKRGFRAVPLGLKASLTLKNAIERVVSDNVIAILPGSGRADEYIFYMAHWDHFGLDPAAPDDQIYNGAVDNATGTAALLELARAFKALRKAPSRSIAFLSVTGEEQGLIGSEYYATHPIYPADKTVAVINMDALDVYGRMKDVTVVGFGQSELDDYIVAAAAEQGRAVRSDPTPERGSYYRSDHFPFARAGIPAIYVSQGVDHVVHGEKWTREQMDKFLAEKYHKPTDEFNPSWDLSGALEDLRLIFKMGYRLSQESTFPNWKEGSEFKAKRDAVMKLAGPAE
jgi:Zn-dependent M28 family amino/carboxypeptidase